MSLKDFRDARCIGSSYNDVILHWLSTNIYISFTQAPALTKEILTWSIQADRMNMNKICEHDQKIHYDEHYH